MKKHILFEEVADDYLAIPSAKMGRPESHVAHLLLREMQYAWRGKGIDQIDDDGYRLSVWTACDCKTRTKHRDVRCCKRTDMSDHSKCESLDTCVVPMPATSMMCEWFVYYVSL